MSYEFSAGDVEALALGYLCGSIPFGLLLTRWAGGPDLRTIGSGNIGATNVLRTGRKDLAALTLVLDALKSQDKKNPGAGPHPRSPEWERTYGQAIGGDTCARQVGTVQRWYDSAQRDAWEVRAVAFGVDIASGVERAVGARAEDDDFEERLTGCLDEFVDCRWPRLYLAADPAE